jgi:hypothetical protein
MRPLTLDDLLPLDEYAGRRRECFESLGRYLDRYRRVRVGPCLTVVFENRQTLWFRVQEVLRVARLTEPERVQEELALYNRLLPGRNRLQAALLITRADGGAPSMEELAAWQTLTGESLRLCTGNASLPAQLVTCRPEDRCSGTAHWLQFVLDAPARKQLADARQPAYVEAVHGDYRHRSTPLDEEVRQSLLDDLTLSDRHAG